MPPQAPELGFFERYLTLWVLACIGAGIGLGQLAPGLAAVVAGLEVARVNLPVGLLIWFMIIPMLVKVDFARLHELRRHARGIGVTFAVNWLIKPFSMALLGWVFVRHLFADWLPAAQQDSYIAGLILLAAAPCTAMVFVWSNLSKGEPNFTLTQVALNASIAYLLNRRFGVAHCVAAPSALIGASNFFELAVAAAINLFGLDSGAALATVVGVLIEVPSMLLVVRAVNASKRWYESGPAISAARSAVD